MAKPQKKYENRETILTDIYTEMVEEIETAAKKHKQSVTEEKNRLERENASQKEYIKVVKNAYLGTYRGNEIPKLEAPVAPKTEHSKNKNTKSPHLRQTVWFDYKGHHVG